MFLHVLLKVTWVFLYIFLPFLNYFTKMKTWENLVVLIILISKYDWGYILIFLLIKLWYLFFFLFFLELLEMFFLIYSFLSFCWYLMSLKICVLFILPRFFLRILILFFILIQRCYCMRVIIIKCGVHIVKIGGVMIVK